MCFGRRIRLTIHERMIESLFEYIWSDLPAQIAIDTRVIDKEIARDVLRIRAVCISHKNILGKELQKKHKRHRKVRPVWLLWLRGSLSYRRASIFATRRRCRSSVKSVDNQVRTMFRICSNEIAFAPRVRTFAPLCSRLLRADASS